MDRGSKHASAKAVAERPAARKPRAPAATAALARELAEAHDQQEATGEILRIISRSPSDVQPVFDTIARSAARLCNAEFCHVFRYDGELIHFAAHHGLSPEGIEAIRDVYPMRPGRGSASARSIATASIVQIPDVDADPEYAHRLPARVVTFRSIVAVPMLRDAKPIGAIAVARKEAGPFPERQVALFRTFADQAVIAIENARLFNELDARNRDLAAALEQKAATSEILHVISTSPTDVQPVLDAVAERAARLCKSPFARVLLVEGDALISRAQYAMGGGASEPVVPVLIKRTTITGRAVVDRATVHVADIVPLLDAEFPDAKENARRIGSRAVLAVPLMREGAAFGGIFLWRREPGFFSPDQVALVETFARQVAIAIDNVRLFRETKEALEHQTATSEILRAIAGSPTDIQPVLETVVRSAARFCGAADVALLRLDGAVLRGAAAVGAYADVLRRGVGSIDALEVPATRASVTGRAVVDRRTVHIHDLAAESESEFPTGRELQRRFGHRTMLAAPLLREGTPLGVIALFRMEVNPFSDRQVELLRTFADQAVIAIENVRLFMELGQRNRDLSEALEQQTATGEILRVISRSPTDVQPVFDTIAQSALTLCRASAATVLTFDGTLIHLAAAANVKAEATDAIRRLFPRPPSNDTAGTRAILTRSVVAIPDVLDDPDYSIGSASHFTGFRGVLAVPLVRDGAPIGAIAVGRPEAGPFAEKQIALLQTFADQAVIAIENVRLFTELGQRNRDLTEALEQQTATSEILRVISSSPADVQPVFDIIAQRAGRLCNAGVAVVSRVDGERIELAAIDGLVPEAVAMVPKLYPMRMDTPSMTARIIRQAAVVHIADVLADRDYGLKDFARTAHYRSGLGVPIVRKGKVIGSIFVGRSSPGLFAESQVQLLKTFADQAAIAIENVRLFNEREARNRDLTEALEQQTATSGILRVISQSPTDVQPVFDTIAASALKLCEADVANVVTRDGDELRLAAHANVTADGARALRKTFPRPLAPDTAAGRAILTTRAIAIPDVLDDPDYGIGETVPATGFRSVLCVPLLRDGSAIGALSVGRSAPGPFPETQVSLLKTFADQAVIAIENVRLFTELGQRNRDLTEALEQQTATSEILRVISRSPIDVQPVFDTIAEAAMKLCRAGSGNVFTFDGELIRLAAIATPTVHGADAIRDLYPRRPGSDTGSTRAVATCSVVIIEDVLADEAYKGGERAIAGGFRSILAVPLIRDGSPIGAITVGRPEPGDFPDAQIALLQTFADQAVIAIENVRLFRELEAKTAQLTRSVEELKALGEVGQAVSSTLDLETVLSTIVARANQLAGMDGGVLYEYDETRNEFHLHAADRVPAEIVDVLRSAPIPKGEGAIGRLAATLEPVEIRDIVGEAGYQSRVREILIRVGYRSLLAVPLLREDHLLGALVVHRSSAGAFAPEVIDLLRTFAAQSALALQNARLFREIEVKGRELEVASRHKSEFLANMSHELRTPLNAIIGFSEVLAERMFGEVNDKQAEYLADILESGRHLLALINDILDLSKIEAGRMELEPSDFSLPNAIDNALTLVRERAQRRGIVLGPTIDVRLGVIRADERKVKQVLLNLLSNAIKFTPEGGRIDVRADVRDGFAEISVADTGVGIAPEDQATVFEEFRQVGAASRKVEGTGLGLAISRKFIELHGGRIWVTSEVGKGSTFGFTLPLPPGATPAGAQ